MSGQFHLLKTRRFGPFFVTQFFGGTSLLILVGVLLDVMRQVETDLLQRHYDGFLRKGRIKGRFERSRGITTGHLASSQAMLWLYIMAAVFILLGVAAYMLKS